MKEKAYFVFRPRRADELLLSNPEGRMMEYRIVKTILLGKMDFENFSTDLLTDRQFIEDNVNLCAEKGDCLLVTNRERVGELLIIPWKGCFVRYAALRPKIHVL